MMHRVRRAWSGWRLRRARRAEEHAELRQGVAVALQRLRELGLGGGSRWSRPTSVPWYALIGASASGKSAALRALGFEPLQVAAGGEARSAPVSGWCSGEAVCWELSAALLEPGPERPDAGAAARELARHQPDQPLAGVLIAFPVQQLLAAPDTERAAATQRLRACVELLQQVLQRELPVYLLLTQVDQLPGFAPFWTRLEPELCQAPWGASWQEREPEGGSFGARVAAEWAVLGRVLHARALAVMGRAGERDAPALFGFSARFAELGEQLSSLVQQLTESHPCRPALLLRGFYLCTARPPCQHSQRSGWFCEQLFQRAILCDRGSVRLPASVLERERQRQRWQSGALLLAGGLACFPALLSRSQNLSLIHSTALSLRELEPQPLHPGARSDQGAELERLLAQLERLEHAMERFRVQHWWGPYTAPELERKVARRYRERLAALIQGPLREQLQAELRAVDDVVRFDWQNFREAADTLKLYLMLTQPAQLDAGWAAGRLLHSWQRARERGACGGRGPLEPHIQRWLRALPEEPSLALPVSDGLVMQTRARLSSLPVPELGLAWLAERARSVPAVSVTQVFPASAAKSWHVPADASVPGLYTRAGWELVRPALEKAVFPAADAWIFGRPPPSSWSREAVQQLHLKRHATCWRTFFLALGAGAGARAQRAIGADTAWGRRETIERIQVAAQPDAPLARLFQLLAQNVRFPLAAPGAAAIEQAAGQLKEQLGVPLPAAPSPLEQEFAAVLAFGLAEDGAGSASSALAEYQKELRALSASLESESAPDDATPASSAARLRGVASTAERLLGTLTRPDRELLEGLLLAPIEDGLAQLRQSEQRRLAELWRARVILPLRRLEQRFPFTLGASEDVELAELQGLLEPRQGALWRFVEVELAQRVQESEGRFELLPASGDAALSPALVPCLGAARELRELLFAGEGREPLAIRLASVGTSAAALSLVVDGQKLEPGESAGEQGWLTFVWPGKGGPAGAAVQLRAGPFADEIRRMGSFGWLRLLLAGGLRPSEGRGEQGTWEASWALQRGETRIVAELRAQGAARVPSPELFRGLACPVQLFASFPGGPP